MKSLAHPWSRRAALLGVGSAALLAACDRKGAPAAAPSERMSLAQATAGEWRDPADKARDVWRHPAQSLEFWGLKSGMTVVELWPGAGWYTDIIAPYLAVNGGKLYAVQFQADDPTEPAARQIVEAYTAKLAASPKLYGKVEITSFGPTSGAIAPSGSADLVLFLRNVHNWMAAGLIEKAFAEAYGALKPGGVLGVEEHRGDPGGVQDVLAANGYVQEAYVKQLAQEAGFLFEEASPINANPRDTKDHPNGVWTLPPGNNHDAADNAKYKAIGESDRMTLRFVKPAQ